MDEKDEDSADNVAQRYRQNILENHSLFPHRYSFGKKTDGDQVHVRDTVLETAGDKSHYRQNAAEDFRDDIPGYGSHYDCKYYEHVAEEAANKALMEWQRQIQRDRAE